MCLFQSRTASATLTRGDLIGADAPGEDRAGQYSQYVASGDVSMVLVPFAAYDESVLTDFGFDVGSGCSTSSVLTQY